MKRSGPIERKPMKRRQRRTGPTDRITKMLYERAGNACESCGSPHLLERQHRRARGMGGTDDPDANALPNLLLLCHDCHVWAESRHPEAQRWGLWVSQWRSPPEQVPVFVHELGWQLLTPAGTYRPTQPPETP